MSVEAPTEARPVAHDSQNVGLTTESLDAMKALADARAAERALGAEPAPKPERSRSQVRHDAEMERLSWHRMTVHSEALRAAIDAAMPLKQRAYDLGQVHEAASLAFCDATEGVKKEAATTAEDQAEAAWQASRAELDNAALVVAHAPFSDIYDVVARAEAFAEIVGRPDKDAPPEFDEDHLLMLGSYRQAVMEMIERQPSRGDWDDAVAGLHEIERRIVGLQASHPESDGLTKAWADRDAAITDLFSMQPPHLDGALLLLDLVREARFLRSRTYRNRAADVDEGQITISDIRAPGELGAARSLALIGQHIARLRDLEMPRDWRDAMRDFGRIAPGAADAVRNAFDQGMHLPELTNVQLGGLPDSQLPVLHFGERTVGPDHS
ncbi:hypothetical protein D3C85_319750 [compost metagenome]